MPCWLGVADAEGVTRVGDVGLMADRYIQALAPHLVAEPGSRILLHLNESSRANAAPRWQKRVQGMTYLFENEKLRTRSGGRSTTWA
jgi:hypothetical protein